MGILSSLFGIGGSRPRQETVVQSSQIPTELAPFVKQILGEARDLYQAELERGYEPYTGLTSAPFTPEQELAQEGITGLVGTTAPYLEEAVETYREGAEEFTPEVAEEFMSPYQRAVTDIEKREAQRTFERDIMPKFEAEAVRAGGLSGLGSRAGVQAAELQRGQQQLLADIEAKGLQSAYQDARLGFEQQKARERQMAGDVGRTGPALFQAGLAEQGALMGVGEQRQQQAQTALDEAYFRFLEERGFPQQTLGEYSQTVYGNPVLGKPSVTQTTTGTPFVSSPASQLMGLGLSGLNMYGMAGGFSPGGPSMQNLYARPGMPVRAKGGPVIKRQKSGVVGGSSLSPLAAGAIGLQTFVPKLATQAEQAIDQMGTPRTKSEIESSLGKKFDVDYMEKLWRDLREGKKLEHSLASQLRANALDRARKSKGKVREEYYPKAIEEAGKINVGSGVGQELRKKRPEGETPIEFLTKVMGAATETGGEQIQEGFKKVAELKEKQYGEGIEDITEIKTEEVTQLDKDSQIRLADTVDNFKQLTKLAGLDAEEEEAVSKILQRDLTVDNLLLEPAKAYASLLTALGSTISKTKGKGLPKFTTELERLDKWAAETTTGVTLIPDPNNPDKYILGGVNNQPLKADSVAMKQYQKKRSTAYAKFTSSIIDAMKNKKDPRVAMAISINDIMGGFMSPTTQQLIPNDAIKQLRKDPSPAAKKDFDTTFGVGTANLVLGNP
tara:strand:+ start:1436 stop:3616 length:2181 start_codon:yes stop_codon:yes gene_type:complete